MPHVDEDMGRVVDSEWLSQAEAILLGRSTYEMMWTYWSQVTDPDDTVARVLNTYPKFLVSQTYSDDADWGGTRAWSAATSSPSSGSSRTGPGGELQVHGSWQLVQALHEADLVDLYRLLLFPTVVGNGKRLFGRRGEALVGSGRAGCGGQPGADTSDVAVRHSQGGRRHRQGLTTKEGLTT